MPDAIWRPRDSIEALQLDRASVHQALSECAVLDSPQRRLHLLQRGCVEFRFTEVLTLGLVGDAGVTSISSRVDQLLASRGEILSEVTRNAAFEFKESLLVAVDIHRSSSGF